MAANRPPNQVSDDGIIFEKHDKNSPAVGADHEIILFEEGNPWCIKNMLTGKLYEKFDEIPAQYFGLHEKHLENIAKPSELEDQIRLSFWDEYFVSRDNKTKIDIKRVYGRLCTRDFFYRTIIEIPAKYAYMLLPPAEYAYRMRSLLDLGHKRLRQVLEMPLKDGKNVPNIRLITEIVKIVQMLENRVHGSIIQKIDVKQQTKNLNMNVTQTVGNSPANQNELEKLQREIDAIEKQQQKTLQSAQPDIIDTVATEQYERNTVRIKTATGSFT